MFRRLHEEHVPPGLFAAGGDEEAAVLVLDDAGFAFEKLEAREDGPAGDGGVFCNVGDAAAVEGLAQDELPGDRAALRDRGGDGGGAFGFADGEGPGDGDGGGGGAADQVDERGEGAGAGGEADRAGEAAGGGFRGGSGGGFGFRDGGGNGRRGDGARGGGRGGGIGRKIESAEGELAGGAGLGQGDAAAGGGGGFGGGEGFVGFLPPAAGGAAGFVADSEEDAAEGGEDAVETVYSPMKDAASRRVPDSGWDCCNVFHVSGFQSSNRPATPTRTASSRIPA